MSIYIDEDGTSYEFERGVVEATSSHRPDPSWRCVDRSGHEHRWHTLGEPATSYRPDASYEVPSLRYVEDYPGDDEYPPSGHFECRLCGEHVERGFTADTIRQYVVGLVDYRINGERVSEDEFRRRTAHLVK